MVTGLARAGVGCVRRSVEPALPGDLGVRQGRACAHFAASWDSLQVSLLRDAWQSQLYAAAPR